MDYKKLFANNKQVTKFLKKSSVENLGDGIESAAHLSASIVRNDTFTPALDYSDPKNFVKYGSAKKYYSDAFSYILDEYPYDGSNLDQTKFYNNFNPFEKYIFDVKYPRSTGYVIIGADYGSTGGTHVDSYYSSSAEYIQAKGGPYTDTKYSRPQGRTNNLEFGAASGSSVEFFMKKEAFGSNPYTSSPNKEIIFDLWNGSPSSSLSYGRTIIELDPTTPDRFYVSQMSGTSGFGRTPVPLTGGLTLADGKWRQFSFVVGSGSAGSTIDFYVSGTCYGSQIVTGSGIGKVTGSLIGNVGALRTAPSGNIYHNTVKEGWAKFSGSLDEFRFWKKARNAEEVGRYWFTPVYGGTDKQLSNVSLGVYYKFNAGITGIPTVDNVVLDYSGRITNGFFRGYNTECRNTGSAINDLALTSVREVGDPIIRKDNVKYINEKSYLEATGSWYDYNNNANLMNSMPAWIIEDDEKHSGELSTITQIMASYFDTLFGQIAMLPRIKNKNYVSGSIQNGINEFPHNDRLLDDLGLEAPELFANASLLSEYLGRDEQIVFDQRLVEVKNSIYKNIYNNLTHIYKTKGTSDAIRNFIRCLGVGSEILALNTYANDSDFTLESTYQIDTSTKKFIDFSGLRNSQDSRGTIYQYYNALNTDSYGQIPSYSDNSEFALTAECEFVFPNKENQRILKHSVVPLVTASLFGFNTPLVDDPEITDTTWAAAGADYGLHVRAIKSPAPMAEITNPPDEVKDVYFAVYDRAGTVLLTSSIFQNAYENQKWNIALSLRPKNYQFSNGITGSPTSKYTLELCGYNYDTGILRNSFVSTASYNSDGANSLESAKRFYVGAYRLNNSGSLLSGSDVRASSFRLWSDYLPTGTIELHAKEPESFGRVNPYENAYQFQVNKPNVYIPKIQTLMLNWDFATISGSDASGRFLVPDFSSGSVDPGYESQYQGSDFSKFNLRQYTGRGDLFAENSDVAQKEYIYAQKLQPLDYTTTDEMVDILDTDVEIFTPLSRPVSFFFAVEKSMYRSISNRMLELFSSIDEFNNLVGEPVNRFRLNYKRMEKIREIFYRKVGNVPDLEKYVVFYKWLDEAMTHMVDQLFPASSRHADDVRTLVENTVLERPKIRHFGSLGYKNVKPRISGSVKGPDGSVCHDNPGWKFSHAPLNNQQKTNCYWWKTRTERSNPSFGPGSTNAGVLNSRTAIFKQIRQSLSSSQIVCIDTSLGAPYIGGINQYLNKKRNTRDFTFDDFALNESCNDEINPNGKKSYSFRVTKDGESYKGQMLTPFTALSSSVSGGYRQELISLGLGSVDLTNMHEDSIYPYRYSVPLQGPFTRTHVGGIQSRHVPAMATAQRKESFLLNISSGTGSVDSIITGSVPKGQYLRGMASKSPVNIENIKTITTGSMDTPLQISGGVNAFGNYQKNYEVVQTANRALTNMDFVFNNQNYYTGSIPSAFVTPPSRRSLGLTGSADYAAPRRKSDTRKNQSIFAVRFAAPGSRQDSKQQFRDVPSDQYSPNNALPFRNMAARQPYLKKLASHVKWGGFSGSSDQIMNLFTVLSGSNHLYGAAGNYAKLTGSTALNALNQGEKFFGYASASLNFSTATFVNGDTLTLDVDGYSYSAQLDNTVAPGASSATVIGVSGVGTDAALATAILNSLSAWAGSVTPMLPFTLGMSSSPAYVSVIRMKIGKEYDGVNWGGSLPANGGITADAFGHQFGGIYLSASAMPYHKTQRNTTHRLELGSGTSYITSSVYDNAFVTRPIPEADRTLWFYSLSGSGFNNIYNQYIVSGSRYPANITLPTSSLGDAAVGAHGVVQIASGDGGVWNGQTIRITDALGNVIEFLANNAAAPNSYARTAGTAPVDFVYSWGTNGISASTYDIMLSLWTAIQAAQDSGDLDTTGFITTGGTDFITLISTTPGTAGNQTITGTAITAGSAAATGLSDGTDFSQYYFGNSVFSASSGFGIQYVWDPTPDVAPWTQTRASQRLGGSYYTQNLVYEIDPTPMSLRRGSAPSSRRDVGSGARTYTDRAGNTITKNYSNTYKEPPITSRYFPLKQMVRTRPGKPSKTKSYFSQVVVEGTYGNELQGFANRQLNEKIALLPKKYLLGRKKRPYDILRDAYNENLPRTINSAELIFNNQYSERIYPREIYTYLSGSRSRLSYKCGFWKSDGTGLGVGALTFSSMADVVNTGSNNIEQTLGYPRLSASFTNSQGYGVLATYQTPFTASAVGGAAGGTGSIWPLDSFIYSHVFSGSPVKLNPTGIDEVLVTAMATMPAGELLTTRFGTVFDQGSSATRQYYNNGTRPIVTCQYVYNIPWEYDDSGYKKAGFRYPGGPLSRPSWTAGRERRSLAGTPGKRQDLQHRFPFYNSYEDYAKHTRLKGQASTIIPEFRISEHLLEYSENGDMLELVKSTLNLTGASNYVYNSDHSTFITRYGLTDQLEYLSPFMERDTVDFQFNKNPKSFGISSEAVLKLLPYDGFYPASRTLQLATLFSSSYAPAAKYRQGATNDLTEHVNWQILLKPFFAPGILYNSIKSGIAVDHPIRRPARNSASFNPLVSLEIAPLAGALSGTLNASVLGSGQIPGNTRRFDPARPFDFTDHNVNHFLWADRLPFESIMDPAAYLRWGEELNSPGWLPSDDINYSLFTSMGAYTGTPYVSRNSASIDETNIPVSTERLYQRAMSNFLGAVPEFFLGKKTAVDGTEGFMTKFVAVIPKSDDGENTPGDQPASTARTVSVNKDYVYTMEVGITKTDYFNLYSNPYAFGIPTSTGSVDWDTIDTQGAPFERPWGLSWPNHRAEFAPFTPPYFYGTSVVKVIYMPSASADVTLEQIMNSADLYTEYYNENERYYDFSSGTFADLNGNLLTTQGTPEYGWNRAYQNRMDIDASIVIDNQFPAGTGKMSPLDPNKWVIMPKWEAPILDMYKEDAATPYNHSSSVDPAENSFDDTTAGMWHQYGVQPQNNEGVYLFVRDIGSKDTEKRLIGNVGSGYPSANTGEVRAVRKLPAWVPEIKIQNGTKSLARLVGFPESEIMGSQDEITPFDITKAKRLGELAPSGEKKMREAIVAIPYYVGQNKQGQRTTVAMTLTGDPTRLGPKVKEFRRAFSHYVMPPTMVEQLQYLVPRGYPEISQYINPFAPPGDPDADEYNEILSGGELSTIPVVYLLEHETTFTKQDLADMWQGIMPDIGENLQTRITSISHYMPCEDSDPETSVFPELLEAQQRAGFPELGGHPRVDLLDVPPVGFFNGVQPEIKWVVFKVKQKGVPSWTHLIGRELNGQNYMSYDNFIGQLNARSGLDRTQLERVIGPRDNWSRMIYKSENLDFYNWPYDYCSLVELGRLKTDITFRPELKREAQEVLDRQNPEEE